ncbi:MAG: hypothetical protein K8R59_16430 [Thermoanaerobaculales bacterium]|nr:hypothetical protein [Thermoanaerobaculales bacterium]
MNPGLPARFAIRLGGLLRFPENLGRITPPEDFPPTTHHRPAAPSAPYRHPPRRVATLDVRLQRHG